MKWVLTSNSLLSLWSESTQRSSTRVRSTLDQSRSKRDNSSNSGFGVLPPETARLARPLFLIASSKISLYFELRSTPKIRYYSYYKSQHAQADNMFYYSSCQLCPFLEMSSSLLGWAVTSRIVIVKLLI